MNLIKRVALSQALPYMATSTGSTGCNVTDNLGYEGVMYVLITGSSASTGVVMHVEAGSSSGCGDSQDLTGTEITSSSTGRTVVATDVYRPAYRYTWPIVTCVTESAYQILAIQYGAHKLPTSHSSDVTANEVNIGTTGTV